MYFYINDIKFEFCMDISDIAIIKSYNKDYVVHYSKNTLKELVNKLYSLNDFIIIDRNVYNLDVSAFALIHNIYIYDATEDNKNVENVMILIDIMLNIKFTKNNKLIVIGGGITQEVGGFAAAIYKRGINWILIPTTILAMTDSCIGSKVSLNRQSKNLIGLMNAPNHIYISDYFLQSLLPDDIISGVGESFKLSLIGGQSVLDMFYEKLLNKNYIDIIKISTCVKKVIIEYDEFDECERKVLNYGHTIGHALESTTNYYIPHGIGVLIGMYVINTLFYPTKYESINVNILKLIDSKYFNVTIDCTQFIKHILNDKKNNGSNICFILLDDIGKTKIVYRRLDEIELNLLSIIKNLFKNTI